MLREGIFVFICLGAFASARVSLKSEFQDDLLFNLRVDDEMWLSNMDVFLTQNKQKLSYKAGDLTLVTNVSNYGYDRFGNYTEKILGFSPKSMKKEALMYAVMREYMGRDVIFLGQSFPYGVANTSVGDKDKVCTGFPVLAVNKDCDLGFLAYGGIMFGETNRKVGMWNKDSASIKSGLDSGPIVLFNKMGKAVVMSSVENVMAGSTVYEMMGEEMTMQFGLLGMADDIPKLFTYSMVILADDGINAAMSRWGEALRYLKNKPMEYRESDFANNYIGYWTDNGAYYYYETEPKKNYEQTILDVYEYAMKEKIPYRYVQFDSWWYPKGPDNGVLEWLPMKSVFPHGLEYLWNKTGWASVAHNRWWSSKTGYAKSNGGKWNFIVEKDTTHSLPVDSGFWDNLMKTSKEWGLLTYEQDWLNVQFESLHATQTDLRLGRTWLKQMGRGAERNGLTIQYCMAPSRCALQSLEIPVVTQARVSGDYQPGNDQWKIGMSSILAEHLGVAPFKDNFWTTTKQSGGPYGKTEPYPALQSVVATMSTGPVGPSDKIGCSNVSLIMKSCNCDGLILKPLRPARAIDKQIIEAAYNKFPGEIWSTYTALDMSHFFFGIIFGADFNDSVTVTPKEAGFGRFSSFPKSKVFSAWSPSMLMDFSETSPLKLSGCTRANFCLYHTSPVLMLNGKEVVLLGELSKWVPMSHKRVLYISVSKYNVEVALTGGMEEVVHFSYMYESAAHMSSMHTVTCILSASGTAVVSVASGTCISE